MVIIRLFINLRFVKEENQDEEIIDFKFGCHVGRRLHAASLCF
jgi:hypothetical protein